MKKSTNSTKVVKSVELFNEADLDKAINKAEVVEKAEKPKTTKKATTKKVVTKKAEKVEKSEKSQSTEKPKKTVAKKSPKAVEKTADKEPKKATKKAEKVEKVEAQEVQEIRPLDSIKVAKTEYVKCENIKTYDDLVKEIEKDENEIFVAFDISNVDAKEYESIFHVPFEKSMKDKFDICTPIFVGEKNPRIVFASIYSEALWDLFPGEFDLLSAVLVEKPSKTKK